MIAHIQCLYKYYVYIHPQTNKVHGEINKFYCDFLHLHIYFLIEIVKYFCIYISRHTDPVHPLCHMWIPNAFTPLNRGGAEQNITEHNWGWC